MNRWRRAAALLVLLAGLVATSSGCQKANFAIGDSITHESREEIQRNFDLVGWPGEVHAVNGIRIDQMRPYVQLLAAGEPVRRMFFYGGTNDALQWQQHTDTFDLGAAVNQLDAVVQDLRSRRPSACLFFVTVQKVFNPAFAEYNNAVDFLNGRMEQLDAQYARVHVLDWKSHSAGHPEWFEIDAIHLSPLGEQELADFYTGLGSLYSCP